MEVHGEGSVLVSPLGAYGVGLWKNIRKGWGIFVVILDLSWEMAPSLDFGLIFDVGIQPLRKPF
jgi:hypothetical protein